MKKLLMLALMLPCSIYATLDYGGKTQYQLRQYDTGFGREQSLWHTHTTNDLGNPYGVSMQVVPFVSLATRTSSIAKQLTLNKSKAIAIASDRFLAQGETTLPYHAIKHNTALDAEEENATVTLHPSVTITGATLSMFHDGARLQPGLAGSISVPVFYIDAHLKQTGASTTIASYLEGTFSQESPSQEALLYGKFGSNNAFKVGPITAQAMYNVVENERSFAGGSAGLSISLLSYEDQTHLLSAHSSAHDNHKIFVGFDAGTTLSQDGDWRAEVLLNARYSYLFGGNEKRIVGILSDDGSIPAHSHYLLGAEKNKQGVFPLANQLHRTVRRGGNHQLETSLMGAMTWRSWTANIGYGFFARREESITVADWPSDTYAIAYNTYDTSGAFANSATTGSLGGADVLLNNRFLTEDMVNPVVAQSPQQVAVTMFSSIGYNGTVREYPIALGAGLSYDHSLVRATPSMLTFWLKLAASF